MSWAAGAAGLAGVGGALLTNAENRRESGENRRFQEIMSSTAHQRQVKDLKAAGLNPLLSATGGASTPSGGQATMENVVQGGITSALETARVGLTATRQKEEVKNLQETNKLIKAQTNKAQMETHVMQKDLPRSEGLNMLWDKAKGFINKIGSEQDSSAKGQNINMKEHRFYKRAQEHNKKKISQPIVDMYKRRP